MEIICRLPIVPLVLGHSIGSSLPLSLTVSVSLFLFLPSIRAFCVFSFVCFCFARSSRFSFSCLLPLLSLAVLLRCSLFLSVYVSVSSILFPSLSLPVHAGCLDSTASHMMTLLYLQHRQGKSQFDASICQTPSPSRPLAVFHRSAMLLISCYACYLSLRSLQFRVCMLARLECLQLGLRKSAGNLE